VRASKKPAWWLSRGPTESLRRQRRRTTLAALRRLVSSACVTPRAARARAALTLASEFSVSSMGATSCRCRSLLCISGGGVAHPGMVERPRRAWIAHRNIRSCKDLRVDAKGDSATIAGTTSCYVAGLYKRDESGAHKPAIVGEGVMTEPSDQRESTWEEIWELRDRLLGRAAGMGLSSTSAEDVVANTILRAWEKRSDFKAGNLEAWLHAIQRHLVLEWWRAERRAGRTLDCWDNVPGPEPEVWDCEGEPLCWLTPSVLSLLLPNDLAIVATEFLGADGRIPEIAARLSERKHRRIDEHYTRSRLSQLKKALISGLGCSFALDSLSAHLCDVDADVLLSRIQMFARTPVKHVLEYRAFNDGSGGRRWGAARVDKEPLVGRLPSVTPSESIAMFMADFSDCDFAFERHVVVTYLCALKSTTDLADEYLCGALGQLEFLQRSASALRKDAYDGFYSHIERLRKRMREKKKSVC